MTFFCKYKQLSQKIRQRYVHDGLQGGFTLIELIAVFVLLSILSIVAVQSYFPLLNDSRLHGAQTLIASAQTQLSLEFARRATAGLALDTDSQPICQWVVIDGADAAASILCTGNLDENVAITATIDGKDVAGAWVSPVSSGS
uniref:Prepilin-type N-terminal cleavage/methylation domain-containing protein n=1 Tax=Desulfovibrio sp. U5L TaxID=596152 RepID=I2Q4Q8_9BACT